MPIHKGKDSKCFPFCNLFDAFFMLKKCDFSHLTNFMCCFFRLLDDNS